MSGFVVEPIDSPADVQQLQHLAMQAFNFHEETWQSILAMVGRQNLRIGKVAGACVSGMGFYPLGQWLGGNRVSMVGFALVATAPEHRGRGYAFRMLSESMHALRAKGFSTATLFASTQSLYRKLGFEQAGNSYDYALSIRDIRVRRSNVALRKVDPTTDLALLQSLANQRAKLENGCLDRNPGMWKRLYRDAGLGQPYTYVVGNPDQECGYVIYDQGRSAGRTSASEQIWEQRSLNIRDMVALNADAMRAIWSFVASHQPVTEMVSWVGPASDARNVLTDEFQPQVIRLRRWMMRLLDVRKALVERGYQRISESISFEVADDLIEANEGAFTLQLQDGLPSILDAITSEPIRVNVAAMSPLFSGLWSGEQLHRLGLLECEDAGAIAKVSRVFSTSEPWMPDSF